MAERSRAQRRVIVTAGWLGAAALATGVALAAVSSIGAGIFGSSVGPLDQQQVADALTTAAPAPAPEPTTEATTPDVTNPPVSDPVETAAEPTVITSPGGTVVARCTDGDRVEVMSWSPAQGFRVDNAGHGPAREIDVEFESGEQEVEIKIRCVDGEPDPTIESDD